MRTAEESLGKTAAARAAEDQTAALDVLAKSRDEFERRHREAARRASHRAPVAPDHRPDRRCTSSRWPIRETTQAQAPKVLQKSRTALLTVAALSKNEAELAEHAEHLLALVAGNRIRHRPADDPSHSFARDAQHRGMAQGRRRRRTHDRARDPGRGRPAGSWSSRVRRLPPTTPPPPGSPLPTEARERERELNRLIAELKMVRMLQSRLNDDTVGVDKTRPAPPTVPPVLRREVETLEATQDEIRDSLAKIAERLPFPWAWAVTWRNSPEQLGAGISGALAAQWLRDAPWRALA